MTTLYQRVVEGNKGSISALWNKPEFVGGFIFWVVAGIAAAVDFFRTFGKHGIHERLTDSLTAHIRMGGDVEDFPLIVAIDCEGGNILK